MMRYNSLLRILADNPTYPITVYVGRMKFEIEREKFLEEMEELRGMNFKIDVELDGEISIIEKE
jgi:hypothetical protein